VNNSGQPGGIVGNWNDVSGPIQIRIGEEIAGANLKAGRRG